MLFSISSNRLSNVSLQQTQTDTKLSYILILSATTLIIKKRRQCRTLSVTQRILLDLPALSIEKNQLGSEYEYLSDVHRIRPAYLQAAQKAIAVITDHICNDDCYKVGMSQGVVSTLKYSTISVTFCYDQ